MKKRDWNPNSKVVFKRKPKRSVWSNKPELKRNKKGVDGLRLKRT
jgi:hypothetical protein